MPSAPPYHAPANNSQDELKTMMQMILANQQKSTVEINAKFENQNAKVDGMYNSLNTKFEALASHVKKLDTQVAQTAEAVKRSHETLPGKSTMQSQVAHINAITYGTDAVLDVSGSTTDAELREAAITVHTPAVPQIPARVYIPRMPYPRPRPKTSVEVAIRYEQMFEKLKVEFPSKEVQALPVLARCIDRRAASHCSIEDGVQIVAEEVRAVLKKRLPKAKQESMQPLQQRLIPKVEDPGKFVVPCSIAGVRFADSLCDSGSCVNIMSKATAEQLGIKKLTPTKMTLAFADFSTTTPCGTILDLHVEIGDCIVCADFQVVEMQRGSIPPLLLGRPFMATVGAVMDMSTKKMTFAHVDKEVSYALVPAIGPTKLASSIHIANEAQSLVSKSTNVAADSHVRTKEPTTKEKVKGSVQHGQVSKPFAKISIIIPLHLRDKGDEFIKEMLKGTMSLFPNIHSWQVKDGALAAVRKKEGAVFKRVSHDTGDPHLLGDPSRA